MNYDYNDISLFFDNANDIELLEIKDDCDKIKILLDDKKNILIDDCCSFTDDDFFKDIKDRILLLKRNWNSNKFKDFSFIFCLCF